MSRATLLEDIRVGDRAIRMYGLSAPAAFRGLGMKTSRVMGISAVTERLQELTKRKKD